MVAAASSRCSFSASMTFVTKYVPSANKAIRDGCPDRLAVVATLFGLEPAAPERCRVLEIGCAEGVHLAPLAELAPESHFRGVDLDARAVEAGNATIASLGLRNVTLECGDFRTLSLAERALRHHRRAWRLLVGSSRNSRCALVLHRGRARRSGRRVRELQRASRQSCSSPRARARAAPRPLARRSPRTHRARARSRGGATPRAAAAWFLVCTLAQRARAFRRARAIRSCTTTTSPKRTKASGSRASWSTWRVMGSNT